jgi:hypothetical protein
MAVQRGTALAPIQSADGWERSQGQGRGPRRRCRGAKAMTREFRGARLPECRCSGTCRRRASNPRRVGQDRRAGTPFVLGCRAGKRMTWGAGGGPHAAQEFAPSANSVSAPFSLRSGMARSSSEAHLRKPLAKFGEDGAEISDFGFCRKTIRAAWYTMPHQRALKRQT